MNTITQPGDKLAATLASLSLEPVPGSSPGEMQRGRGRRRLGGILALATVAVSAAILLRPEVYGYLEAKVGTADAPAPIPPGEPQSAAVPVDPPAAIADEITGSGYVVAPYVTTVFSKYEGRVAGIAVDVGDVVEAGQILVTLDDAGGRFAHERAQAARVTATLALAARTIDLDQARSVLARVERLAARDAVPRQQLEDMRRAVERAENVVAQARQELAVAELSIRIAEERIDELTVRAPFAGTVTRLDAHVGDSVLARADSVTDGQSLLTIIDRTHMVIDGDIAETSIASLRPGLRGEAVLDGFADQPFAVEVLRLAPVASVEKGTISLRLSFTDPPEGIRPNMAVRFRIPLVDVVSQIGEAGR